MADIETYEEIVRRCVPRPSGRQIQAFAEFVAGDHSWYKHLPLAGRGEPFFLFLEPNVHAALIEREDGGFAFRDLVREHPPGHVFHSWRLDLQPGDREPSGPDMLSYASRGQSTREYRERFGFWGYWNHGPPDQPKEEALDAACAHLRVRGDGGEPVAVPREVLDLGLVYLRGTVSGYMGPVEDEYEQLRAERGLPAAVDDRAVQLEAMVAAMHEVVDWVYA